MIMHGYGDGYDPGAYFTGGDSTDQPYTVDVGRPDMPVTQTSVDPVTGSTVVHVTGIQPITSFYASEGLDSSGNSPGSSSGSSSGGGILSTLGKIFGGGGGGGTSVYNKMSAPIPTWVWVAAPAAALIATMALLGSKHPVMATAGYRRRRRKR